MPERRERPRGSGKKQPVQELQQVQALSREDGADWNALTAAAKQLREVERRLVATIQNPQTHALFCANMHLLLGARNITMSQLAAEAKCDYSGLSRMLKKQESFCKTQPSRLLAIASSLEVNIHTLLCVDLRAELVELVRAIEKR